MKKENKELREKLKDLNTKLTKVLENLKGNYPDKSFDQRMSPEVMEIEMENADNQINFYKREIAFLQKRTKEGDQVDQIQELEKECYALKAEEDGLEKELSKLKNRYLVLSNKSKKIESSGSQKAKVSAMIEKRKAYILQKKRVTEWSSKLEKTIEAQKDFTDKIHERYTEACKQLREEPELELEYDEEDKAIVKLKNNQKKSSPGLRTIIFDKSAKKKPISFNESLLMDDPDNYEMPKTDAEFTRLKEKVTSMFQSARVEERHVKLTVKRTRAKTTDISKRQETIGNVNMTARANSYRTKQRI